MSPPTIGTVVQVRIPDDDLDIIDAQVLAEESSRSAVIRQLVGEALMYRARKAARRGK